MPSRAPIPIQAEKARVGKILRLLARLFPAPRCALHHDDPYQLIVATILSAQCTDERVNLTTPALFARFPDAASLAAAAPAEVERLIKSCGFFRNKARSLIGMATRVTEHHGGRIPQTLAELVELPGVARKTANVVLGTAFGIASGVVVDTHVTRLAARLALSRAKDAVKIEADLMRIIPRSRWISFSHQLILHGRSTCKARTPRCESCRLAPECPAAASGGQPEARRPSAAEILDRPATTSARRRRQANPA